MLTGFSQGGAMAFALGLRHADKFCGVIPVAGRYDELTILPSGAKQPRFFLMVGEKDRTLSSNTAAAPAFEAAGIAVRLQVYEGVGHAFPNDREKELRKALEYVLGG